MIRVVCLKWGDKYSSEYVNRLYSSVSRNLHKPFTFHCVTENSEGLNNDINIHDLEDFGLKGWWYKLLFFKNGFFEFNNQDLILYLDLDVVILNDLEGLIQLFSDGLYISSDVNENKMNSSVMLFRPNSLGFIWESFWAQKDFVLKNYHGDQDWIEQVMPAATIIPKNMVCSYKIDLKSKTPFSLGGVGRFFRKKYPNLFLPRGQVERPNCAIVLFHGRPNPDDVMDGPWDKYRHAPWVKDFWY